VQPDPELILEDAVSIREAMRRMVRYTSDATERLDRRIEDGTLDGRTEAEQLRGALERVQALSLQVNEELDAYQQRHGR
jgi:flagellar biosynthesis/type III secretory pathway protein FliH